MQPAAPFTLRETRKPFLPIPSYGFTVSEMTGKALSITELPLKTTEPDCILSTKKKKKKTFFARVAFL